MAKEDAVEIVVEGVLEKMHLRVIPTLPAVKVLIEKTPLRFGDRDEDLSPEVVFQL